MLWEGEEMAPGNRVGPTGMGPRIATSLSGNTRSIGWTGVGPCSGVGQVEMDVLYPPFLIHQRRGGPHHQKGGKDQVGIEVFLSPGFTPLRTIAPLSHPLLPLSLLVWVRRFIYLLLPLINCSPTCFHRVFLLVFLYFFLWCSPLFFFIFI